MKKICFFVLIIIWGGIIFYASSRTSIESNSSSKKVIQFMVEKSLSVTNYLRITHVDVSDEKEIQLLVNRLNYPFRKCAHATVYFVLALFIVLFLYSCKKRALEVFIITISFCFLYSLTDEYHQTFINERTGRFFDCVIDTSGAIVATSLTTFYLYRVRKKKC